MTRHCYDTSVLVDVLRGVPKTVRLLRAHAGDERTTTAISAYELALGATTPDWRRAGLELLETLEILPLDSGVAWIAGEAMRELRKAGREAALRDLLIGIIAREAGCTLYTADRSFPRLEGLPLETI